MQKGSIIDVELTAGNVHRSYMNRIIAEGDGSADRFGMRLTENGAPVSLMGAACIGYFIRPDGVTLVINGEISGDTASVVLPAAAYAKTGQFSLAVKVTGSGYADTMRIVDGTVVDTTTGTINDPSSEVPSLADLLAVIEDAEDAADTIEGLTVTASQIEGTRYGIAVTKEE